MSRFISCYFPTGQWHYGPRIGDREKANYESMLCPQIGAEMLNPVYIKDAYGNPYTQKNVNDWIVCGRRGWNLIVLNLFGSFTVYTLLSGTQLVKRSPSSNQCNWSFSLLFIPFKYYWIVTQCAQMDGCNHWQFDEDTKECFFVKKFDGFQAAGDSKKKTVAAGHRNCPAPANMQTLFNMCPDNNEATYMWRNKKKSEFYNPKVGLGGQSLMFVKPEGNNRYSRLAHNCRPLWLPLE